MEENLTSKTIKGTGWSALDNILQYAISFVVSIVLARLLSPDEYGLIGIVAIFTAISTTIINGGFTSALIRKKDASEDDYDTVFIVNLCVSIALYCVLFLIAPLLAKFFDREELIALTRVQSLSLIIGALAIVQRARLTKRIDFKTQTKATFIAAVVSGFLGIIAALLGYGVWSLVIHLLTQMGIMTGLLWFYNKWIPRFRFSIDSFKELFGYSWKLLVSGLLDTTWKHVYQLVIGKFYAPATLGQYTRASQFSEIFSSNLTNIVQRVSFPVLSSIQDNSDRLRNAYQRIIKATMLITFSLMLGLAAISKNMILVLIGEKWLMAAAFLPLICFQMMLYPLHAINLNMLQVKGRSDLFLKLEIAKKIIGVLPILLGIFIDIYWMLVGSVLTGFISYYLNAYYSGELLGYSFRQQIADISSSFAISLFMGIVVYLVGMLPFTPILLLISQITLGVFLLVILCETFHLREYLDMKNLVLSHMKSHRNK